MYLLMVFLPICSALCVGLFGRFLKGSSAAFLLTFGVLAALAVSIPVGVEVILLQNPCKLVLLNLFNVGIYTINWQFLFDPLSVGLTLVVLLVSFLVHAYSIEYMADDPHLTRFMVYLSFFTFFMLLLVTSSNIFQLFIGWEGVGVCSYLLISFWFTRTQANIASIKAFIVNRVGDFAFILGLALLIVIVGSTEFSVVFQLFPNLSSFSINVFSFSLDYLSLVGVLLFVGAMSKSAQLILHTWLPDAMEGPTPVSALIHAATMVAAGVFLLVRLSFLFSFLPSIMVLISFVGASTAFFAATVGLLQNDLKKIIAYSTCSQLGYMVFAVGAAAFHFSFFHLVNHAFFKALLFLASGAVIHSVSDIQDLRRFGSLRFFLPLAYISFLIGSLALMGIPFLSGFFSKDLIIELSLSSISSSRAFCSSLIIVAAFLTAAYSTRLLLLTFFTSTSLHVTILLALHESRKFIYSCLLVLILFSIFFGYFASSLFTSVVFNFFGNSVLFNPTVFSLDFEFAPYFLKFLPVILSLLGIFIFSFILLIPEFHVNFSKSLLSKSFVTFFLTRKWFFDLVLNYYVGFKILTISYLHFIKLIDKGVFEKFGGVGVGNIFQVFGKLISKFQSGVFIHYFITLVSIFLFSIFLFSALMLSKPTLFLCLPSLIFGFGYQVFEAASISSMNFRVFPIVFNPVSTFRDYLHSTGTIHSIKTFLGMSYLFLITVYCYTLLFFSIVYLSKYKAYPDIAAFLQ